MSELYHFGIKGQKWGVRRFENPDGTLTEAGKKRYGKTPDEVRKNAENARAEATRLRRRSDDLNSRLFFSNDISNHRAERKALKAEQKADEYDELVKGFESGKRYRQYAEKARNQIGDASRNQKTSVGSGVAMDMLRGRSGKEYRKLERAVSRDKEVRLAGNSYNKKQNSENARRFADAVATVSVKHINENFSKADRDKAMGWVYGYFIQNQDLAVRKQFGKVNG